MGSLTGFKYDVDDRVQICESTLCSGIVKAYRQPIRYNVRPVSLAFEVRGNSFRDTAIKQHLPQSIVESLEDAFSNRYDLDHMAAGSAVKLIYEERVSHDGVHRMAGDIQAVEIRNGTRAVKAYAFRDEHGRAHLYDEEGHALGPQFLRFPVNFQYISSGFTLHRYHPILHQYRPHLGVDLAALYGTPVKAIADGRVESSGWCGELGNCIRLEHDNSTVSIYGHLSKIDANAKPGSYIKIGQVIGEVGSTGLSTGPHLHFAIEKRGLNVDPLSQTLGVHHQVSPRMQALFENLKLRYQSALAKLPNLGSHFAPAMMRKPARTSPRRRRANPLVSQVGLLYKTASAD
jgi:murein DD-endopeptidase MepM/ murein hydrolase activator NlpD